MLPTEALIDCPSMIVVCGVDCRKQQARIELFVQRCRRQKSQEVRLCLALTYPRLSLSHLFRLFTAAHSLTNLHPSPSLHPHCVSLNPARHPPKSPVTTARLLATDFSDCDERFLRPTFCETATASQRRYPSLVARHTAHRSPSTPLSTTISHALTESIIAQDTSKCRSWSHTPRV